MKGESTGPGRDLNVSDASIWIFGYGSLVWRPDFPHLRACPASIGGYARRFWQGSTDHRGIPERPGRVVTLIPDDHEGLFEDPLPRTDRCWGTAYEIHSHDPDQVLAGLDHRERGGYERVRLEIELHDEVQSKGDVGGSAPRIVIGLVYIAGPDNDNYLGAAPVDAIAGQIRGAVGPSGPNPEYVFELASRLRAMEAADAHVFEVEAELLRLMS